jgi:plastocyanin
MRMQISSNVFYKVATILCAGAALSGFAAVSTVSVQDDVFVPSSSSIHAGDSVIWKWDGSDHNVTSTSNPQAWKATPTESSTTFTFTNTFASAGTFPYECTIHASIGMLGTISVAAAVSPPTITITSPAPGAMLPAPANVTIAATTTGGSGTVTSVGFLVGSTVLSTVTSAPFSAVTNGLPPGSYTLSAVATDNNGLTATNTVSIQVFTPASLGNSIKLSATQFQFSYAATPGISYVIQQSTNLTTWVSIATNIATANPATYSDDNATNNPAFYRVQVLPFL